MSASRTVYWPVGPERITEEAGTRGGTHYGMDFGVPTGTPVTAPFDGIVVANFNDGASGSLHLGGGQYVNANGPALITDIQRDDGLISRVAHLSSFAASPGQRVTAGEVIAYSGNTGFSIGPHVHWELRWDRRLGPGAWVNPRSFNPQTFTGSTTPDGQEEDEEMAEEYKGFIHTEGGVGSKQIVIIGHRPSGYKFKYTAEAKTGRHPTHEKYAAVFNTGDYISVPRDELDAWERSLDEKRQGK